MRYRYIRRAYSVGSMGEMYTEGSFAQMAADITSAGDWTNRDAGFEMVLQSPPGISIPEFDYDKELHVVDAGSAADLLAEFLQECSEKLVRYGFQDITNLEFYIDEGAGGGRFWVRMWPFKNGDMCYGLPDGFVAGIPR
jgi:hypothetical protein